MMSSASGSPCGTAALTRDAAGWSMAAGGRGDIAAAYEQADSVFLMRSEREEESATYRMAHKVTQSGRVDSLHAVVVVRGFGSRDCCCRCMRTWQSRHSTARSRRCKRVIEAVRICRALLTSVVGRVLNCKILWVISKLRSDTLSGRRRLTISSACW